jgi:hypothetical protein
MNQGELDNLTENSVDPQPLGKIRRSVHENSGLTDTELVNTIKTRNEQGKPTYMLRQEYQRRLNQRR